MLDNPKRVLNLGEARCDVCGKVFQKYNGRQKRCSAECASVGVKRLSMLYHKTYQRKPQYPPREIVCRKCGGVFIGRSNQGICRTCLETRSDCRKYLERRSERMEVKT